jgi:septum formation protein
MINSAAPRLVLASTSKYRRALLDRLRIPFEISGPMVDESVAPGEDPIALVTRLARAKAQAISDRFPQSVIIGSDQVAVLGRTLH